MSPGDVVLVRFPFTSLETAKKRPALVMRLTSLTPKNEIVTIAMITSQVDGLKLEGDVVLEGWEKARLLHPSLARLSKIATVDRELIDRTLGRLSAPDIAQIKKQFKKHFHFWL